MTTQNNQAMMMYPEKTISSIGRSSGEISWLDGLHPFGSVALSMITSGGGAPRVPKNNQLASIYVKHHLQAHRQYSLNRY